MAREDDQKNRGKYVESIYSRLVVKRLGCKRWMVKSSRKEIRGPRQAGHDSLYCDEKSPFEAIWLVAT